MKKLMLPILILMIVGLVGAVNALEFKPATGSTINSIGRAGAGTESAFINVTSTTTGFNATNMTITCTHSVSGATLTNTTLVGVANGCNNKSINQHGLNCSIQTFAIEDGSVSCAVTLYNGSVSGESSNSDSGTVTYTIDNQVPALSNLKPGSASLNTTQDVTFGIDCANTSSANLFFENKVISMTESSDACTVSLSGISNGIHTWFVIASDGTNETTSTSGTVEIRRPGGGGGTGVSTAPATTAPSQEKNIVKAIIDIPVRIIDWILSLFGF